MRGNKQIINGSPFGIKSFGKIRDPPRVEKSGEGGGGYTDLPSDSGYLFASAVESSFHLPPGLGIVTPLHQRVVMGIFKGHSVPPVRRLVQPVEVAVSKAACGGGGVEPRQFKTSPIGSERHRRGRVRPRLTQFLLGKNEESVVLVQILVELDGEVTDEL